MADFIRHTSCEKCGSSDGLALYADGSSHCFVCKATVPSEEHKNETEGQSKTVKSITRIRATTLLNQTNEPKERTVTKAIITDEENQEVKDKSTLQGFDYRGIDDETLKFFGCRTEVDDEDNVVARYYPCTIEDKLSGYKARLHPKTFHKEAGNVGNDCDLYGAFRFRAGGKYLLVVSGEEDAHAAYQMFRDYARSKNSDFITACVSLTVGEGNPSKQLANNYEFLNSFDNIIIGMDADEVGREVVNKCISCLPKGKIRVANWTKAKDPNEYLINADSKTFLKDFYAAESYIPAGVLGSDKLYDKILAQSETKKVSFPPFMKELNEMLAGGLPLGHIVNLAAGTSIGKTTLVNEIVYYWLFNSPYKVGVVSMESDAGQYAESLLSRHMSKKISLMSDDADKNTFLRSEAVKKAADLLFQTSDGTPRFYLVDDRDGSVEQLQDVIEQMVISSGCKIVIVDPIQDIFAGLSNEEQETFMKWCKSMIKSHKITFVLINHVRKSVGGAKDSADGARLSESDIHGTSTLIKSSSINILLSRNKMSEDSLVRNTTIVDLSKNRVCGITGPAGALYYDNASHTLFNYQEYFGEPFSKKD